MKTVSCGTLIRVDSEYLIALPFQGDFWNLPKGKMEVGEEPIQTAIRETEEEIGLELKPSDLVVDFGKRPYLKDKDLHLFLVELPIKPKSLKCKSLFESNGRMVPEMVSFKWTSWDDMLKQVNPGLQRYLTKLQNDKLI